MSGGTLVQSSGNNFAAGATVTIGDDSATDVVVNSATSMRRERAVRMAFDHVGEILEGCRTRSPQLCEWTFPNRSEYPYHFG
jgi:hypothetical protein